MARTVISPGMIPDVGGGSVTLDSPADFRTVIELTGLASSRTHVHNLGRYVDVVNVDAFGHHTEVGIEQSSDLNSITVTGIAPLTGVLIIT